MTTLSSHATPLAQSWFELQHSGMQLSPGENSEHGSLQTTSTKCYYIFIDYSNILYEGRKVIEPEFNFEL